MHKMLISHISAEFMERQELAVEWLFHEFAAERIDLQKKATEGEAGRNGRYNKILLVQNMGERFKTFTPCLRTAHTLQYASGNTPCVRFR